jgi:hypothetical protein
MRYFMRESEITGARGGRRLPWSQIHGLSANMLISWLERAARDDVHPDAQDFLKVLKQADMIKKRCTWLEVHEQIQIAVQASLSSGDGAEHGEHPRGDEPLIPMPALSLPALRQAVATVAPYPPDSGVD